MSLSPNPATNHTSFDIIVEVIGYHDDYVLFLMKSKNTLFTHRQTTKRTITIIKISSLHLGESVIFILRRCQVCTIKL